MPSNATQKLVELRQIYMLNAENGTSLGVSTLNEIGQLEDALNADERQSYKTYLTLELKSAEQSGSVASAYQAWLKREANSAPLAGLAQNQHLFQKMEEIIPRDLTQRTELTNSLPPAGTKLH